MSVVDLKLEHPTEEEARSRNLFSRLVETVRLHLRSRWRRQTLQDLPDSVLMDIGVHPATVREPFPFSTPLDYPLSPTRTGGL